MVFVLLKVHHFTIIWQFVSFSYVIILIYIVQLKYETICSPFQSHIIHLAWCEYEMGSNFECFRNHCHLLNFPTIYKIISLFRSWNDSCISIATKDLKNISNFLFESSTIVNKQHAHKNVDIFWFYSGIYSNQSKWTVVFYVRRLTANIKGFFNSHVIWFRLSPISQFRFYSLALERFFTIINNRFNVSIFLNWYFFFHCFGTPFQSTSHHFSTITDYVVPHSATMFWLYHHRNVETGF